jgi:excisionase family DNA binding protein
MSASSVPSPVRRTTAVRRLALSKAEAAESLGVSVDFLERHVMPDVRVVRCGRRRLIPISSLEHWLETHASGVLERSAPRRPTVS